MRPTRHDASRCRREKAAYLASAQKIVDENEKILVDMRTHMSNAIANAKAKAQECSVLQNDLTQSRFQGVLAAERHMKEIVAMKAVIAAHERNALLYRNAIKASLGCFSMAFDAVIEVPK